MHKKWSRSVFSAVLAYGLLLETPANAGLLNLTSMASRGTAIAAGNAACPEQPFYRYFGGKNDNFASPADPAYPSPNLLTFMTVPPSVQGVVGYDVPMLNGRLGDSFNLQNTRSVCYAVIHFRAGPTGGGNDALHMGHVESSGSFTIAASVLNGPAATFSQIYAFDANGRAALSLQTGINLDRTPADSVLDVYLQDDTMIDFFEVLVWYGPPNPPCVGYICL